MTWGGTSRTRRTRHATLTVTVLAVTAVAATACSSASSTPVSPPAAPVGVGVVASAPTGPVPTVTGPVTTGSIIDPVSVQNFDLAGNGYVEQEYFVGGTATAYGPEGTLGTDGKWSVKAASTAAYKTRIVVRRPSDPAKFNGTVVVEWLNVSSGYEAAPDWTYMGEELVRAGYAWVGVSAQKLGVEGGPGLLSLPGAAGSGGLVASEPARYGSLDHPGDQYSYDIYTQVARALRFPGAVDALGPLRPARIVAVGESQSAFFLTTYADAFQPTTRAFDGFFIHSRGGTAASLGGNGNPASSDVPLGTRIRDDLAVPVFVFETQTDVGPLLNYSPARQPDTDRFRLWEVAGTAHADAYQVGPAAQLFGCKAPANDGPEHWVASAAISALNSWLTTGRPPPTASMLQLQPGTTTIVTDANGNALGGVRTPAVDVPVSTLTGEAPAGSSLLCALFGSTTPFDEATLVRLYHDKAGYLAAFEKSLDQTIAAGFLLPADRAALLAEAQQVQFPA